MNVVSAAPLLPRSSFSIWTSSSWPSRSASLMLALRTSTPFTEVGAGDFLERQEAVALLAVVDETRLEAGLDARDHALVDVRLSLLAPGGLDVDVDQLLAVDDAHAQFLCMRGVEEHAFHQHSLRLLRGASRCRNGRAGRASRFRLCGRRGDAQQRPRKAVFADSWPTARAVPAAPISGDLSGTGKAQLA